MTTPPLDIFKNGFRGNPVWIDSVENLEAASHHLGQLALLLRGEYFIFGQKCHQIVASVNRLHEDRWARLGREM